MQFELDVHDVELAEIALENVPEGRAWDAERDVLIGELSALRCALVVGRF
jgi:hypothetical protein